MKKHTKADTMIEMNPTDYYRNDITEYVTDMVCVSNEIETIRYRLRRILVKFVSY